MLKEHVLRHHAGWSGRSQMHLKYLHYGNESSESLLEVYGIITKDKQLSDALKPKQCPNCNEPNKPDSKFCAKCRMFSHMMLIMRRWRSSKKKNQRFKSCSKKYEQDMKAIREHMERKFQQLFSRIDMAKLT
jgi:hypothetical protein